MATISLTDYERKRLENIKRNEELLASLNIKSKLSDLSASFKRHRVEASSYKISSDKKLESETPIVIRKSLRSQGKAPESRGLKDDFKDNPKNSKTLKSKIIPNKSPRELGPISMRDFSTCSVSDELLVNKILSVCKQSQVKEHDDDDDDSDCVKKSRVRASIDLDSMVLAPENIGCVVPNRITSVKFFPSEDLRMVVVGDKFGDVGFWNVDFDNEDGDGIYIYHPHAAHVSSIVIQPFSLNKIITSCYDGRVRSLDIEKETFGLAYTSDYAIFSMSQRCNDVNSLYLGSHGLVSIWDERSGKLSFSGDLHESKVNTIDFNLENLNLMVTSSADKTACIWDLRKLGKSKTKPLKLIRHNRSVQSAYFSPSGSHLATTSLDDKIGVLSGANYEDEFMINHNNQTCSWRSTFKGVWGWDDSFIFVGNLKMGVDVISTEDRRLVTTLESPHMSAIPCRFDAHPLKPGVLAGATSGGQVYVWSY